MKNESSFSILTVFFIFMLLAISTFVPWGKGRYVASGRTHVVGYIMPEIAQK